LLSTDKEWLVFQFSDGTEQAYYAYGDCCSSSWFEHMSGTEALIGGTVSAIETANATMNGQELQMDFISFSTDRGRAVLEFRNESNGYYGGSANAERAYPADKCKPVTEDW
jgi:hypothetical protein